LTVTFVDNSTGMIANRFWNFGDGTTTNTASPTVAHTYVANGTNTVTLQVTGPLGTDTLVRSNYIAISDQLMITSLRLSGQDVLVNFLSQSGKYYRVEYSDAVQGPLWLTVADFVPGNGGIVQVTHVGGGGSSYRFYRVKLLNNAELAPVANFSATPTNGVAPLQVTFTDTSSGLLTNRFWDFGDGTTTNTTLTAVSHLYATPGTNTVTLQVTGPFGTNAAVRLNYIVVTPAVTNSLRITSIQLSGTNVLVNFTSQPGQYYRVEYSQQLGGSGWQTAADFVPGTGSIVQATDLGGATGGLRFYRVKLLTAADLVPSASFSADNQTGGVPFKVTFTDTSSGLITNRLWTFGDGTTSNTASATVSHTYLTAGTNTVTLQVNGPSGSSVQTRTNYIVAINSTPLKISNLQLIGANVIVNFSSQQGILYRLEYADGLAGSWQTAVDQVPGNGGVVQVTHLGGAGSAARFYRLKQLP
jgi:PKD repeat protein